MIFFEMWNTGSFSSAALALIEKIFADERFKFSFVLHIPDADDATVDRVFDYFLDELFGHGSTLSCHTAACGQIFCERFIAVGAFGIVFKCHDDVRSIFGVDGQIGAFFEPEIAHGSAPDPDALFDAFFHTVDTAFSADAIVEFGETGEYAFHEFASRAFIDRFSDRAQFSMVFFERFPDSKMIGLIAGETVEFVDDEIVDFVFLDRAETDSFQEFSAVCSFCRFAFFNEDLRDGNILACGVFAAHTFLRFKGSTVHLFGG